MPDFQRVPAGSSSDGLECVFCGRTTADGADLIAASDAAICDECAAACAEAVNDPVRDNEGGNEPEGPRAFFRVLANAEVEAQVEIGALIDAMEQTIRRASSDVSPEPATAALAVPGGRIVSAAAHAPADEGAQSAAVGVQLTSSFEGNAVVGLPTTLETLLLFSPATGALLALVACGYLADACAAARSAVSARVLARDDAGRLAILGTGRLARLHLEALDQVFELSSVKIWSPTSEEQEALLEQIESDVQVDAARSAEDAVRSADLVVIAVAPSELSVRSEWIADGAHVMVAGLSSSEAHDALAALSARGRLFTDSRLLPGGRNASLLADVAQKRSDGRRSGRDVTMFVAGETAAPQVAAANFVFRKGVAADAGRQLEL
jgi:ornithine cyclodeaminase